MGGGLWVGCFGVSVFGWVREWMWGESFLLNEKRKESQREPTYESQTPRRRAGGDEGAGGGGGGWGDMLACVCVSVYYVSHSDSCVAVSGTPRPMLECPCVCRGGCLFVCVSGEEGVHGNARTFRLKGGEKRVHLLC